MMSWLKRLLRIGTKQEKLLSSISTKEGKALYARLQGLGLELPKYGRELKRDPETDIVYLVQYKEQGAGCFFTMQPLSAEDAEAALSNPNSLAIHQQTKQWQTSNQFPTQRNSDE